ncbi:MAG: hypothetical protein FJW37_04700 [Acidobacteria bacterium]|nr:hypothetical protein [Acidobacteriota bacterium]
MLLRTGILLISVAALSCAQERKDKKRIESVTWDLKEHRLIWVVQKGVEGAGGQFTVKTTDRYEISPDDAIMYFANEKRGFTSEEAASLHKLLDTLSVYCAESVVWWDRGEGQRLDEHSEKLRIRERKPQEHYRRPRKQEPKQPAGSQQIAALRR